MTIQEILSRFNRKSKLYSMTLGISIYLVSSLFLDFWKSIIPVIMFMIVISLISEFGKEKIIIADQTWRPSLVFAMVLPAVFLSLMINFFIWILN
jgi:uncharacterized membrane protein YoaK (UPF0700 family)